MYQRDRQWESRYAEKVKAILKMLLRHLVKISIAPLEKDTKEATDFIIETEGLGTAVRLRRPGCKHRDLTLRSDRSNGAKTELAKIIEGFASRYFYGWTDIHGEIPEWILVDLDKMRASSLLTTSRKPIHNLDGKTSFISFSLKELNDAGCLLERQLSPETIRKSGLPNIAPEQDKLPRPADHTIYKKTVKQRFETVETIEQCGLIDYVKNHVDPGIIGDEEGA